MKAESAQKDSIEIQMVDKYWRNFIEIAWHLFDEFWTFSTN